MYNLRDTKRKADCDESKNESTVAVNSKAVAAHSSVTKGVANSSKKTRGSQMAPNICAWVLDPGNVDALPVSISSFDRIHDLKKSLINEGVAFPSVINLTPGQFQLCSSNGAIDVDEYVQKVMNNEEGGHQSRHPIRIQCATSSTSSVMDILPRVSPVPGTSTSAAFSTMELLPSVTPVRAPEIKKESFTGQRHDPIELELSDTDNSADVHRMKRLARAEPADLFVKEGRSTGPAATKPAEPAVPKLVSKHLRAQDGASTGGTKALLRQFQVPLTRSTTTATNTLTSKTTTTLNTTSNIPIINACGTTTTISNLDSNNKCPQCNKSISYKSMQRRCCMCNHYSRCFRVVQVARVVDKKAEMVEMKICCRSACTLRLAEHKQMVQAQLVRMLGQREVAQASTVQSASTPAAPADPSAFAAPAAIFASAAPAISADPEMQDTLNSLLYSDGEQKGEEEGFADPFDSHDSDSDKYEKYFD